MIVHSKDVNSYHYLVAVLKDKGLKVTSAKKLCFAINFLFEENIRFHSLDI